MIAAAGSWPRDEFVFGFRYDSTVNSPSVVRAPRKDSAERRDTHTNDDTQELRESNGDRHLSRPKALYFLSHASR